MADSGKEIGSRCHHCAGPLTKNLVFTTKFFLLLIEFYLFLLLMGLVKSVLVAELIFRKPTNGLWLRLSGIASLWLVKTKIKFGAKNRLF